MSEQTIKYSSYTEAQKKASKKYRETNKDKVNEKRKLYYLKRKEDPQFLEYKRTKAREYYKNKKDNKSPQSTKTLYDINNETHDEVLIEPTLVEEIKPVVEVKEVKEVTFFEPEIILKKIIKKTRKPKLHIIA